MGTGYKAMIEMDERCLYKAKFACVISANIVEIKGMITGQICSNLTLFLSRTLSRRRFITEMTVSEENSGGIFGLWIVVVWLPLPVWTWLTF